METASKLLTYTNPVTLMKCGRNTTSKYNTIHEVVLCIQEKVICNGKS